MRKLLFTLATLAFLFTVLGSSLMYVGCTNRYSSREIFQSFEADGYSYSLAAPSQAKMMEAPLAPPEKQAHNTEQYDAIEENPFKLANHEPLSTFSIDVDTASYANVRRMLNYNQLPPAGAVRIEEMVNYFEYDYAPPTDGSPFSVNTAVVTAPWNKEHQIVRIGLKGKIPAEEEQGDSNLVFLIDTSGSMSSPNKLGLVKDSLKKLLNELGENDRVSIVTYAGNAGVALMPTPASNASRIRQVIDGLGAGGSTNGAGGIQMAYQLARDTFIREGNNRVILCTDGDFNVGMTNRSDLTDLIKKEAKSGVFLTVLGFGMGNYKDGTLEDLANKGNGNYGYIDTAKEAEKMLVRQMTGTLITIAKDVKIQIEFNPSQVKAYRLIGYENRMLENEDFNDDKKDAGEIGAGHTVTALYEIVPVGAPTQLDTKIDPLKYSTPVRATGNSTDLLTLKLRYKAPDGDTSKLMQTQVKNGATPIDQAPADMQFAVAVASFGMILRNSKYVDGVNLEWVKEVASSTKGEDPGDFRAEFVTLVVKAQELRARLASKQ